MAHEVEVCPLSRISPYLSVITVTTTSKPLRVRRFFGDGNRDDDVTVPEHASNLPSCRNPIGIGKSAADDAHDGDDNELQRFSEGGATLCCEIEKWCDEPGA
jgi:hypothetical protein